MEDKALRFTDASNDQLESILSGDSGDFFKNTSPDTIVIDTEELPEEQMAEEVNRDARDVVIEVKDLYKIYKVGTNKVHALNGVDFKVYEGEFCAIVGTSGSGKSTLLNMLAGLEKPTKGEIIIAGHHIEKMNENKLVRFRRKNVGFIFQSFNLLGTMNALENVALPLSFRGMPKELRLKKAMKMLKLVGLKEHALHKPNQMSGGQQQRVGMARALVVNPKIMFADEPTGNLDSKTSKEMMDLMRNVVNKHKKTLVMVTHDDSLAAVADKVIRIVDGKIISIEDKGMKAVEDGNHEEIER
jgi:putative ABC transport system ATP-binding protein